MKKIKLAALTTVIALALTSCVSTGLEISTGLSNEPKEALLTGMSISVDMQSSTIADTLTSIAGSLELDDFGAKATENLSMFLESKGFVLFTNPEIAKREIRPTWGNILNIGYWNHEDTSNYTSSYFTGFAIGFNRAEFIAKVKQDDDINYFIFSDIQIDKRSTFAVFGTYPVAIFKIAVVDQNGEVVLKASATGVGNKRFLGTDTSASNLGLALNDAITKLNAL